jgi:hypothetical protein
MNAGFHDGNLPFQVLKKLRRELSTGDGFDGDWFARLL